MADPLNIAGGTEKAPDAPSQKPQEKTSAESPRQVSGSREGIAQTLTPEPGALEEGGESIESSEVRETVSEGSEVKGDGMPAKKKKDDDKKKKDDGTAGAASFTFDEKNLPPAPQMIRKIELHLRKEIKELQKEKRKYEGRFFSTPDYPKLSETVNKIRKKEVLLKRIVHMAYEALKKVFIQMFKPKSVA